MATMSDKVTNLVNELKETAEADGASYCIFIVKGHSDGHVILDSKTSGEEAANLIVILLKQIAKTSGLPVKKIMNEIERGIKKNKGWELHPRPAERTVEEEE